MREGAPRPAYGASSQRYLENKEGVRNLKFFALRAEESLSRPAIARPAVKERGLSRRFGKGFGGTIRLLLESMGEYVTIGSQVL